MEHISLRYYFHYLSNYPWDRSILRMNFFRMNYCIVNKLISCDVDMSLHMKESANHSLVRSLYLIILLLTFSCEDNSTSTITPPSNTNPKIYDWSLQSSGFIDDFSDIYFSNENSGWVVGENNLLLSTASGGKYWPEAPVGSTEGDFRSVIMIDEQRGWIGGTSNDGGLGGSVFISKNGGAYPESQKQTEFPINSVFMLNENYGWACGERGQIIYTTDGLNWSESTTELDFDIYDIHFADQQNGWIAGAEGNIFMSKDGGISWDKEFQIPEIDLLSIQMTDTASGWVCGEKNTFYIRSIQNGIINWESKRVEQESDITTWYDLHFINEMSGWLVGSEGIVYKTADGGNIWKRETTGVITDLRAVYMATNSKGWIVGDEGVILTYTP